MNEISFTLLQPIWPELFLAVAGMVLLVIGAFRGNSSSTIISWASIGSFIAAAALVLTNDWTATTLLSNMLIVDGFGSYLKLIILAGLALSVVLSLGWLRDEHMLRFEYPLLILFAGIGMLLMVSANDFLTLYVALELQSLPLYVLAAIRRDTVQSAEAGIKYFVLGALSSGLLLFGISLIYGYAGTTNFDLIGQTVISQGAMPSLGIIIGMVFVLSGLAFKISAVPFHMWTPDVYEGAATPVTTLFAMVPKIAAIALLIRVLEGPFAPLVLQWSQIVVFLAVASMIWGAFAALGQENIKRLMAYSSISNMGYALIGLLADSEEGVAAIILYLTIYMAMTAGTFAIILGMRKGGAAVEKISDLSGLSKTNPGVAYALAGLMFSMSGIPPLAGFFGKLFVFQAAVAAGQYTVAVIGVIASVVASYYYLRIIKVMFFDQPAEVPFDHAHDFNRRAVLVASIAFILAFAFVPTTFLEGAKAAAASLFQ